MNASDIPTGYSSPSAMARSLATYLTCPEEIRKRVMGLFSTCPARDSILEMITQHRRPPWATEEMRPGDDYSAEDERHRLDRVNKVFVQRLAMERTSSALLRDVR